MPTAPSVTCPDEEGGGGGFYLILPNPEQSDKIPSVGDFQQQSKTIKFHEH